MDNLVLRPYCVKDDMEDVYALGEVAYVEDYARIGRSPTAGLRREKRVVAVLSVLERVFPALRDLTSGYVWTDGGRVVSFVHFARGGLGGDRWSIETVMTHPEYQRRGLARRLVEQSLEAIRARGGRTCVLKVRADNHPAYALYRSLGFSHVDSTVHLKLGPALRPEVTAPGAYSVRAVSASEWFARWRDRFELAQREHGEELEILLPVSQRAFRRPMYVRWIGPILMKLSGLRRRQWIGEHDGRMIATLSAVRDQTDTRDDELTLCVDPEAEADVSAPLLATGLAWLDRSGNQPVLMELSSTRSHAIQAAQTQGFREIMTWHRLALRLG